MTKRRDSLRIAVVGCGIAGPTTAFLLAEQGHHVTLFEQAPELSPVGAGVMLQPLGQLVLAKLGLLEDVVRYSEPIYELHAIQRNGKTMIRMPFSASGLDMHAYGVHRQDIFNVLVARAQKAGVSIVLDTQVMGSQVHRNGASTRVSLIDQRNLHHSEFDYVIVTSGARTLLRSLAGFRSVGCEYQHGAIWINAQSDVVKGKLLQVVHGSRYLMGILPLGMNRISLFWGLPCRESEEFMNQPIEHWRSTFHDFYPECQPILESIQSKSQATFGKYRKGAVHPTYDDHHLFLGDAAHPMSPHLGQGLNIALLDAYSFAKAFEEEPTWQAACRRFKGQRSCHLSYYRFVTGMLAPFFQSDAAWRGHFRDAVLPWFHRLPWIRGQMALTMTGLKRGWLGGPLEF